MPTLSVTVLANLYDGPPMRSISYFFVFIVGFDFEPQLVLQLCVM